MSFSNGPGDRAGRSWRRAKAAYARSFLYTETDENDATYFVLSQLRVIIRAIEDLHGYLKRRTAELRSAEERMRHTRWLKAELNHRQLALVNHAMKHGDAAYTVESHRISHGVVYQTARTDLLHLTKIGLLEKRKRGRTFVFVPSARLLKIA